MDFFKVIEIVNSTTESLKECEFGLFLAAIAMICEERCKAEGEDITETFEKLTMASRDVVAALGKY